MTQIFPFYTVIPVCHYITGTRGELRIYAPSLLIDKNIELRIPFQLAPCPHGYLNPTLYDPSLPENRSVSLGGNVLSMRILQQHLCQAVANVEEPLSKPITSDAG